MSKGEEERISVGEAKKALEGIKEYVPDGLDHDAIVEKISGIVARLDVIIADKEQGGEGTPLGTELSEHIKPRAIAPQVNLKWANDLETLYISWRNGDASQPSTERNKKSERNARFLEFGLPTILAFIVLGVGLGLGLGVFTDNNKDDLYFVMESVKDIGGGLMAWLVPATIIGETSKVKNAIKSDKVKTSLGIATFCLALVVGIIATVGCGWLVIFSSKYYSQFGRSQYLWLTFTTLVVAIIAGVYLCIWPFLPLLRKVVKRNKEIPEEHKQEDQGGTSD